METQIIIEKLNLLEQLLTEQNLLSKQVLNFKEACTYLDLSESHLYKLTSSRQIPHFCPQGKRLYFNRQELDAWLQSRRQETRQDIEKMAANYLLTRQNRKP